jgi:CheY-like chemotaxis protein
MPELFSKHEFWAALASLAWPAIALFALYRFWPAIETLLKRDSVTVKLGGFELSSQQVVDDFRKNFADIQKRISGIELARTDIEGQSASVPVSTPSPAPKALLWVDDFPSNNALLIESFTKEGIDVVLSLDTSDALKKLKNGDYSAVITDLGRKEDGIDNPNAGLDLLIEMRKINSNLPTLVFAGSRGISHRKKLLEHGAAEVTASGVDVFRFVKNHFRTPN